MQLLAQTFSIQEAKQMAERFEIQGYITKIIEKKRASISIYEIWGERKDEIFEIKPGIKSKFSKD